MITNLAALVACGILLRVLELYGGLARILVGSNMRTRSFKLQGLNDLLRTAALLALWPRCFDASVEAYSANDPNP